MEQNKLPTKTKIATWLTIIYGLIIIIGGFRTRFWISKGSFYLVLFLIPLGFLIFKKRKWAWWGSIILLSIQILLDLRLLVPLIFLLITPFTIHKNLHILFSSLRYLFFPVFPFILFITDSKNFLQMASKSTDDSQRINLPQVGLPMKTKIATLLMNILGLGGIIFYIIAMLGSALTMSGGPTIPRSLGRIIFISPLSLLLSFFITRRKKTAWTLSVVILSFFTVLSPFALFGYQCESIIYHELELQKNIFKVCTPLVHSFYGLLIVILLLFIVSILLIFIIKGKKWSTNILLSLMFLWALFFGYLICITPTSIGGSHWFFLSDTRYGFFISLIYQLPLILILSDRKNFFKIAV